MALITCTDIGEEEWRPVVGWDGLYEVSAFGRVRSLGRVKRRTNGSVHTYPPRQLTPSVSKYGYLRVGLSDKPRRKTELHSVHRLVAAAFVVRAAEKDAISVNHIDGNKLNNCCCNLEWVTPSYNSRHGWQNGLMRLPAQGEFSVNAKLTNDQARAIYNADLTKRGSKKAMASVYGVSVDTITLIKKGLRYAVC